MMRAHENLQAGKNSRETNVPDMSASYSGLRRSSRTREAVFVEMAVECKSSIDVPRLHNFEADPVGQAHAFFPGEKLLLHALTKKILVHPNDFEKGIEDSIEI